jgi:hypothetical protein
MSTLPVPVECKNVT